MATKAPAFFLALAVAAILAAAPAEPASNAPAAPAPAVDCQSVLTASLASCFSFVMNGSTEKVPDKECCKDLTTVIKENLVCICKLANDPKAGSGQAAELGLDTNRVMMLPQACKANIPADKCAKLGLPVKTPIGSPKGAMAPASAPSAGGPTSAGAAGAATTGGNAPAPTSQATRISTAVTSSAWALLIAVGLPIVALAAAATSLKA